MAGGLTEKRRNFVDFYLGEAQLNATKAAKLAGFKGSEKTVAATASRLLRDSKVRDLLDKKARESADETAIITPERLIELLAGFAEDVTLDTNHRLKAIDTLCKVFGMNLQKIKVDSKVEVTQTKVEIRNYLADASVAQSIQQLEGDILDTIVDDNDIVVVPVEKN